MKNLKAFFIFSFIFLFATGAHSQSQKTSIGSDPNENIGKEETKSLSVMREALNSFDGVIPAAWLYSLQMETDTPFRPSGKGKSGKQRGRSGKGSRTSN